MLHIKSLDEGLEITNGALTNHIKNWKAAV